MQLYPAIDIKDGQCVRLKQGQFKEIKVYSDRPEAVAVYWQEQGATYLHLVDLDGAVEGRPVNEKTLRKIIQAVDIPVEVGGGIRSRETVLAMLEMGVDRVIIGTKAAENPEFLRDLVRDFGPDHIAAGVDAIDGKVALAGWERVSGYTALEVCLKLREYGVRHVIYTDISRDGMLSGPNLEQTKKLTVDTGMDVIASGGISSKEDLDRLCRAGIGGAIIGKALYEHRIFLKEVIQLFEQGGGYDRK